MPKYKIGDRFYIIGFNKSGDIFIKHWEVWDVSASDIAHQQGGWYDLVDVDSKRGINNTVYINYADKYGIDTRENLRSKLTQIAKNAMNLANVHWTMVWEDE